MASVPAPVPGPSGPVPSVTAALTESQTVLSRELRRLTRVATVVAVIASPSVFYWYHHHNGMGVGKALILTFLSCIAFRGIIDITVRKIIPWPSLFGTADVRLREEEIVNRRRAWTWSTVLKWVRRVAFIITFFFSLQYFIHWWRGDAINPIQWTGTATGWWVRMSHLFNAGNLPLLFQVFFLFIANMLLFMGPLLAMGIMQIKAFEPGDAEWGVKLEDVRGQAEAKEEIRRIVTLWQSGEVFEKSGGKRERGLLFLGAPGTGKTMMAKAIATGFNSPFVTIPGSGFAQAFIGIDAVIVRVMAARAKRLARKWGGNCIVFIDEIDAVGMRRSALGPGGGGGTMGPGTMNPLDDYSPTFYGPHGALNPSGDVIVESPAWRDYMFAIRAEGSHAAYPGWYAKAANLVNQGIFPGMGGGGQLALNQLLVVMDGVDNPPFLKRFRTNRVNTFLDAIYILPRRLGKQGGRVFTLAVGLGAAFFLLDELAGLSGGSVPLQALVPRHSTNWTIVLALLSTWTLWGAIKGFRSAHESGTVSLRLRQASATGNQIYFIGATNVPVTNLDPALTRPGRMGRHVTFRTPTKEDRKDIFALYLDKVAHNPELDSDTRRDEIARITNGYSPAMIDQICSMALTNAHHSGRAYFEWEDLVEAMTVIESGTAVDVQFIEESLRATAIHEAGHAATAHVYRPEVESSRLSIRMRGRSGGHHQSFEKEERFGKFQSMMFGELIHDVGAMAAELAFYGENSNGVGGDMGMATGLASAMVGAAGMSPLPLDLKGKTFDDENEEQSYQRVMRRFEDIGYRMMNRSAAGWQAVDDPRKRAYVAQFMGQALAIAYNLVIANKDKVENVANAVMEKREIFGDDLVRLLDDQHFEKPDIDWTREESWPKLMNWSRDPREMRLVGDSDDEISKSKS